MSDASLQLHLSWQSKAGAVGPAGRRIAAAAVAIGVHALALLPLLVSAPEPQPANSEAIMVGVTVGAPTAQAAVPASTAQPMPAPAAKLPRAVATHASPTEHSIAVNADTAADTTAPASTAAADGTTAKASAESDGAIESPRYQAAYLNNPQPPYPAMSRKQREEGMVRLHVMVDANGRAKLVKIKASSGYERLDMAARAAVQEWRFVPARQRGQSVAGWVEVPVQFQLEK